ncbi:hypothetical protein [Hydrogenophaga palleronii]|uniref:hypothetical protein n=1 Tax=Hydrogenophaga palleronii TaxID=65655 RepID=UPI0012EDABFC|nr:hypothetical protein [Hydrogenophaga palleronii]
MITLDTRISNFLSSVAFFTDLDVQRAVWVDGAKGVTSVICPSELYCQFFDDNDIDDFIDNEMSTAAITDSQKMAIRTFRDKLNEFDIAFDDPMNPKTDAELIETKEWADIRKLAELTLEKFGKTADSWNHLRPSNRV